MIANPISLITLSISQMFDEVYFLKTLFRNLYLEVIFFYTLIIFNFLKIAKNYPNQNLFL